MKRFPTIFLLAASLRWSAWLITVVLLWRSGAFAKLTSDAWPAIYLGYATLYGLIWTRQSLRIVRRKLDVSVMVFYDLILSLLPVWLSGGWNSPFVPFALGSLAVPTLYRGWRGGSLVAAAFLAIDQVILWTTAPNPWQLSEDGSSVALLGRTLLPFGVVAAICVSMDGWRWISRQRGRRRTPPPLRRDALSVRPSFDRPDLRRSSSFSRASDDAPLARTWSKETGGQPIVERRSVASVQAALRHSEPELTAAGVTLRIETLGEERRLVPQLRELLVRGVEIALDNVVAHARARSVTVRLEVIADTATLGVIDDGIGLFDGTAEPPGFHQIKRLRFRAEELGGSLRVEERDSGGVLFELRVPLKES